jgi:hypothetical protein
MRAFGQKPTDVWIERKLSVFGNLGMYERMGLGANW